MTNGALFCSIERRIMVLRPLNSGETLNLSGQQIIKPGLRRVKGTSNQACKLNEGAAMVDEKNQISKFLGSKYIRIIQIAQKWVRLLNLILNSICANSVSNSWFSTLVVREFFPKLRINSNLSCM